MRIFAERMGPLEYAVGTKRGSNIETVDDSSASIQSQNKVTFDGISSAWSSLDSLSSVDSSKKKKLCFNDRARVLLIPTVEDYKNAGIFDSLWHDAAEMQTIRSGAEAELRRFMTICGITDRRKALRILWR